MHQLDDLTRLAQEALLLSLALCMPVVGVAALAGLMVAIFQAATQVQDFTLAHLPRLLVVALVLSLAAPWMGAELVEFTQRAFSFG